MKPIPSIQLQRQNVLPYTLTAANYPGRRLAGKLPRPFRASNMAESSSLPKSKPAARAQTVHFVTRCASHEGCLLLPSRHAAGYYFDKPCSLRADGALAPAYGVQNANRSNLAWHAPAAEGQSENDGG